MQVTWWIPAGLSGMTAPMLDLLPARRGGPSRPAARGWGRGLPSAVPRSFFVDAGPDLGGQWLLDLLAEMPHQADGARDHGQAARHLPGDLELARQGADGARGVDGERLAEHARGRLRDLV